MLLPRRTLTYTAGIRGALRHSSITRPAIVRIDIRRFSVRAIVQTGTHPQPLPVVPG